MTNEQTRGILSNMLFFIPPHMIVAVYCSITLFLYVCQCVVHSSVIPFPDDNFNKCEWIFPKLGVCIDIMEIWIGIANGQIFSIFDKVTSQQHSNYLFTFLFKVGIIKGVLVSLLSTAMVTVNINSLKIESVHDKTYSRTCDNQQRLR